MDGHAVNNPPMKNDTNNSFRGDIIDLTDDTEPQQKGQTVVSSTSNLDNGVNKKIRILENTLLNPSTSTGLALSISPSLLISGNEKNTSSTSCEKESNEAFTEDLSSPFIKTYTGRRGPETKRNLPNLYLTTADGLPLPSQEIIVSDDIDNDDVVLVEERKKEKPLSTLKNSTCITGNRSVAKPKEKPPAPKPPPSPTGQMNTVNQTPNITPLRPTMNKNVVSTQITTANLNPNRSVKPVETGIVSPNSRLKKNTNVVVNPLNFAPIKGIVSPNLPLKKITATSNSNIKVNKTPHPTNFKPVKPLVKGIISPNSPMKKITATSKSNMMVNPLTFIPIKPKRMVSPNSPLKKTTATSSSNVMVNGAPNPINAKPVEPMETPMAREIIKKIRVIPHFPVKENAVTSNLVVNSAPNRPNFKAKILARTKPKPKPKPPVKAFNPVETLAEIVETATAVANIEPQENECQPNQPIIYLLYPLQNSSDVLVASNDPNHVEEPPIEEAPPSPIMTNDVEIEPPCVVTPVDITKILNQGKKPDLMSRCEEAPLNDDQGDFLGFTRRERRKTACCSFYKTLLKIDMRNIKMLKKSIEELSNYQKNVIYCACPSDNFLPETIKEELSPECIKIEDEDIDPFEDQIHDVIYNTDALPSISEVISQVNEEVRQIKQMEATIQKNELQAKLTKPEQALKLIKEGLELIQSWSKEANSSVDVEEVPKKKRGRPKTKIDEEVPKPQNVVPVSTVTRKRRGRKNGELEALKKIQKRKRSVVSVSDIRNSVRLDGELPKKRGRKKKVVEVDNDDDLLVVKRIDIINQSGVKTARKRKAT
ncbi:hypothetical protein TcasGA2_TC013973 [Tribolium castaneum]|uniref:Uncharacterized protein n=1 Tax=Tribolium castaneum TaxID=7070 RepID=D6WNU2_TRICA|nr:PREDICTED: uncharacterized protein LOC103312902 [Tribolium castaneum]EFA03857.1 hypothetical protein TcasGA2_TC013973 [Tribolium castaneum]|eukprot:XP_008192973.1 PREDICTED: uncharacterized protein LOC103312902 [Tribolium castaneum]